MKTHQKSSKLIKTHQNVSKLIKTQQNSSKLNKTHQNSSKDIKTHQNSSKLIKTHQNSLKHIKPHQNSAKVSKTQQKSTKMCILSIAHKLNAGHMKWLWSFKSWAASNFLRRRELRLCLLLLKTWVDYCRCILSERHLWLRPIIWWRNFPLRYWHIWVPKAPYALPS